MNLVQLFEKMHNEKVEFSKIHNEKVHFHLLNMTLLPFYYFSLSVSHLQLFNNNLPLKIYCENIVIPFLFFFLLFFPSFFILHTRTAFLFFPFFSPPHTYPYTYLFLLLSSFTIYHFLQTQTVPALLLPLFFFFFFFSPFLLALPFSLY